DVGRLREIAVPARMLGRTALRRDDDDVGSVLAEDERRRALLAAIAAGGREDENWRAVPEVADLTVGLDVLRDMLGAEERAVDHDNRSSVFAVKRSSASTDISRCSFLVSSSFVCESPRRDCTNSITVGTPARATSAASWSGPLGSRWAVPPTSRIDS